ncbi:hypothetical protein BDZ97DRAFT_1934964 [Flammula alnicola]|nr:hypothetical protein BDZ97DRAFT_1934964 [Flammula alnicola]
MDMDELEKTIVVDNMRSGFDVYPIHRSTPLHTFEVPTKRNFVRMVVFGEKGTVIVGGSDHGKVYIFDLKTPQLVQYFIHGKPTSLIQAIITTSLETRHLIVTGSSDDKSSICVWEKPASHQYLCSAHRFNWAMTLQTQRALLHKRRENKRRGEVGLVLTLLFLNLVFGIISPAWFQAFKKDLADISTRARSAAEKALTDPFETSRGQERIQGTTIPQDALVIPRDIAMQLPHGVLMQLGEQTARSINIGHRFTENDFQNSQEVVAESIAKPELE